MYTIFLFLGLIQKCCKLYSPPSREERIHCFMGGLRVIQDMIYKTLLFKFVKKKFKVTFNLCTPPRELYPLVVRSWSKIPFLDCCVRVTYTTTPLHNKLHIVDFQCSWLNFQKYHTYHVHAHERFICCIKLILLISEDTGF